VEEWPLSRDRAHHEPRAEWSDDSGEGSWTELPDDGAELPAGSEPELGEDNAQVGTHTWAIHGVIPVDGDVIMAEFDTYREARIVLDRLATERPGQFDQRVPPAMRRDLTAEPPVLSVR
jgi:hypothetical protein